LVRNTSIPLNIFFNYFGWESYNNSIRENTLLSHVRMTTNNRIFPDFTVFKETNCLTNVQFSRLWCHAFITLTPAFIATAVDSKHLTQHLN
jgi:hypothetical protein